MCGLAGAMSSSLSAGEGNIFRGLLNIASFRGYEGSGVIVSQKEYMKASPTIRTLRTKRIAGQLAYSAAMDELLKPRCNAVIGHARWPTKGGVDIKAVHPHRSGHIVGVHNGTMWKVGGEDVKDRSDSAMLFQSFAEKGVIETIKNSEGAYALVWIDEKEGTLNFLRNAQRTLFFKNVGWNENINTLYWSSERDMLDFVFKREYRGTNTWDTYLPENIWYKYPLDVAHVIRPVEVIKDVKPERKVTPVGGYSRRGHGRGRYDPLVDIDDLPWMRSTESGTNVLQLAGPGMSQKKQQRLLKAHEREEAARKRRLEMFRAANAAHLQDISTAMRDADDLNDDVPDLVGRQKEYTLRGFEGHECAWCSANASVGDLVYPVNHGSGGIKEFLCMDCSKNDDCKQWVSHTYAHTIVA